MSLVDWSPSMSVGVALLDDDHRALVGIVNRLDAGTKAGEESAALGDIVDSLIAYTEYHFGREEKIMEACGFPGWAVHHDKHSEFTEYVYGVRAGLALDPAGEAPRELVDYLQDWLTCHILIQDMAYKPYIQHDPRAWRVAWAFGSGLRAQLAQESGANHRAGTYRDRLVVE